MPDCTLQEFKMNENYASFGHNHRQCEIRKIQTSSLQLKVGNISFVTANLN